MTDKGKRIKAHLSAFSMAAENLERNSYKGINRLAALGQERNVIRQGDMTATGELGEATRLAHQSSPALVLFAFTLELCLKALIEQEGCTAPRTHDLEKLLEACPAAMQDRIRTAVCDLDDISEAAFVAELAHNKAVFEVWRYSYEDTSTKRAGLGWVSLRPCSRRQKQKYRPENYKLIIY